MPPNDEDRQTELPLKDVELRRKRPSASVEPHVSEHLRHYRKPLGIHVDPGSIAGTNEAWHLQYDRTLARLAKQSIPPTKVFASAWRPRVSASNDFAHMLEGSAGF